MMVDPDTSTTLCFAGGTSSGTCKPCTSVFCTTGLCLCGCGGTSSGVCVACKGNCPVGQYKNGCTADSSCVPCSPASCLSSQYLSGCGELSSGTCLECVSGCPDGQYLSMCGGTSNGTCVACPSCAHGMYLSGCGGISSGLCVTCKPQEIEVCSGNTFYSPTTGQCIPLPSSDATPAYNGLGWTCVDGTVGTYGLKKYNLPCSAYTFSSTLNNAPPCSPYASAGLSEGYNTFGWCVSCQIAGNCPGAWAQADLGLVGNVAGVYVAGRSGFCNFPLTLQFKSSVDGITWEDVDCGYIFPTGITIDSRCSRGAHTYMIQKPLSTIRFAAPLLARYIRVYPLTSTGFPTWNTYGAYSPWWMCMQFEPLGVSDVSSNLVVMYPFANAATLAQGYGYLPTVLTGPPFTTSSWTSALGGGLFLGVGQVSYSPFIDFNDFSEFTLTYWTSVSTNMCRPKYISFGLVDEDDKVFYGLAPCYGSSKMSITFDSTRTFNCFGCGQTAYGKNLMKFHGRRSGDGTNFFWFGQGGNVDASNGMSSAYEIFNIPKWPGKLRLTFGSPGHRHVIKIHDVRLYRDSSLTKYFSGSPGSIPFDTSPTPRYDPSMDSCAICQPGFYCANNQVFACPPNSSAGFHATSISQCVCTLGLYKDSILGCRACEPGFYCPNQNSEVACSVGCPTGFVYQSADCSSSADRVCTACPSTIAAATALKGTPSACICPANSYNNGTGGCSVCPLNAVSPANSYGLSSCTCVSGFFLLPTMDNATGKLISLQCNLCPAGTYSLANTQACFPYPPNTVVSNNSALGFFCPKGYFMPTDVPVRVNTTTQYPSRPGMLYWNFESPNFSVMRNEWGSHVPANGGAYIPPRIYPEYTTSDIQALNPNVTCKFGSRCALIGGTSTSIYKYTLTIPSFTMPASGISVSFWFRVNSCRNCGIEGIGGPVRGLEFFNFAGVSAKHIAVTSSRNALSFVYNSLGVNGWDVYGSGKYDTTFSAFKDAWHHHLFTFLPGGNFSGYLDGVLKINKNFNKDFPRTVSGSFFLPNYYNGMVDDFAIFEGDVSPYLSRLQAKPANQALDGTGIAVACVPCFVGMYCNNNTATACPNNKTSSLASSAWETDCQCNEPGKSGYGNLTACNQLCPANHYCLGYGYPTQNCPDNQVSSTNASILSQCTCPLPFNVDYLGKCVCPNVISQISPSSDEKCMCSSGFIGYPNAPMTVMYPSLYGCGTTLNPQCKASSLGPKLYNVNYLFDSVSPEVHETCTAIQLISPAKNPFSFIQIDFWPQYIAKYKHYQIYLQLSKFNVFNLF
jgi:hypothetical protein